MSFFISKVRIEVLQQATEDPSKVTNGLKAFFSQDFQKKIEISSFELLGYHKNEIKKYQIEITSKPLIKHILQKLFTQIESPDPFLDLTKNNFENQEYFVKIDKQNLIANGKYSLAKNNDVYLIYYKLGVFGSKKHLAQNAEEFLKKFFSINN